jgi:thioredoxin 1
MKDITDINVQTTLNNYIKTGETIIVDFFAPWCGPCRVLAPQLDKLPATVLKINGDNEDATVQTQVNALMEYFQVSAYPTVLVFKNGSLVQKVVGANIQAIKAAL